MTIKHNDGGAAYPCPMGGDWPDCDRGMSLRDYFIAHAPAEPQPWFEPVMTPPNPPQDVDEMQAWYGEQNKQRHIQWPAAWADAMLQERSK